MMMSKNDDAITCDFVVLTDLAFVAPEAGRADTGDGVVPDVPGRGNWDECGVGKLCWHVVVIWMPPGGRR